MIRILIIASVSAATFVSLAIGFDGYDMSWHTIDCGGGQSSAMGYELHGTIGQPDPGTLSGGRYTLHGGYWVGVSSKPQPTCLGDLNHDGFVNVSDLLILLNAWGPCPETPSCPADLNGDNHINVSDLLVLFGAWGPCP